MALWSLLRLAFKRGPATMTTIIIMPTEIAIRVEGLKDTKPVWNAIEHR